MNVNTITYFWWCILNWIFKDMIKRTPDTTRFTVILPFLQIYNILLAIVLAFQVLCECYRQVLQILDAIPEDEGEYTVCLPDNTESSATLKIKGWFTFICD